MTDQTDERAVARLFGLTDAVFAIAMTLLVIDIKVPELGKAPTTLALEHALGENWPNYVAFLVSFYVIASYWRRHHRQMRFITSCGARMIGRTILMLVAICAMPFTASLLGAYGNTGGIAMAIFALVNAVAVFAQLRIQSVVQASSPDALRTPITIELYCDLVAYIVAAVLAYSVNGSGVLILVGSLAVAGFAAKAISTRMHLESDEVG